MELTTQTFNFNIKEWHPNNVQLTQNVENFKCQMNRVVIYKHQILNVAIIIGKIYMAGHVKCSRMQMTVNPNLWVVMGLSQHIGVNNFVGKVSHAKINLKSPAVFLTRNHKLLVINQKQLMILIGKTNFPIIHVRHSYEKRDFVIVEMILTNK